MSAALPPLTARGLGAAQAATGSARIRFRRALTLMVMTVILPGSAQLVAGNKRVGRIATKAFGVGVLFVAVLVLLGLFWRSQLLAVGTQLWFLTLLRVGLIAYGLAWAYLVVDAWRIADPLGLQRRQRLFMTGLNGLLCLGLSGALLFASHLVAVQKDFIATVFGGGVVSQAEDGRYNVLLLGGDAGPTRVGIRPDSITVASIDEDTGRTVLLGLPRNLADVPFPDGSVMDQRFPEGFDCEGCYLNGVNTWANDHSELFPGVEDPGVEATRDAVEEITGLKINYYALIDLKGFEDLVDAVGGVTMDVGERIPIGGVGAPITGWIEPGRQHLDGFETLWFARSRATSDDYSRMARQKCVMNAMLQQLDPKTVVTRFGAIAKAGQQIISTSIPASEIDTFVHLSMKAKNLPLSSVSFVPPEIDTGAPDWDLVRSMVDDAIAAAEAKDDGGTSSGDRPKKRKPSRAGSANDSTNVASTC